MTQRRPALTARVSPVVDNSVRRLTKALGITISEYLRKLILDDLESKQMFEDELKKAVEQSEANVRVPRRKDTLAKQITELWKRGDDERY